MKKWTVIVLVMTFACAEATAQEVVSSPGIAGAPDNAVIEAPAPPPAPASPPAPAPDPAPQYAVPAVPEAAQRSLPLPPTAERLSHFSLPASSDATGDADAPKPASRPAKAHHPSSRIVREYRTVVREDAGFITGVRRQLCQMWEQIGSLWHEFSKLRGRVDGLEQAVGDLQVANTTLVPAAPAATSPAAAPTPAPTPTPTPTIVAVGVDDEARRRADEALAKAESAQEDADVASGNAEAAIGAINIVADAKKDAAAASRKVSTLAARVDEISGQVRYDRAWLRSAWAVVWLTLISLIALATALWWHWARGRHARCPYCGGDGSAGDSCPACEGWAEERATREAAGPLPAPATDPAPPAPPPAADE